MTRVLVGSGNYIGRLNEFDNNRERNNNGNPHIIIQKLWIQEL
jgi:hypothetical protein